jgi:hypothetical protein
VVAGNYIGTNAAGNAGLGNGGNGVMIANGAQANQLGGTAAGTGNTIAFNAAAGVNVIGETGTTGNRIQGNSIHSNGGLGIDLGNNGVSANDVGDADAGPNNLQNLPVLSLAEAGAMTRVVGSLNSTPNTTFVLDFYANSVADPSGQGEGEKRLGSIMVTTDASGNVSFDISSLPQTIPGQRLTATATDPNGNTSEFAFAAPVRSTIQFLTTGVMNLVAAGTLSQGQGTSLLMPLNAAQKHINDGDTIAAISQMRAFMNHVDAFVLSGVLPRRDADLLLDAAALLIQQLGG